MRLLAEGGEVPGWSIVERNDVGSVFTDGNTHITSYRDFDAKGGIPIDRFCEALELYRGGAVCGCRGGGVLASAVGDVFKAPTYTFDPDKVKHVRDGDDRVRLGRGRKSGGQIVLSRAVRNPLRETRMQLRDDRDARRYHDVPAGVHSCLSYSS